ncbi:MAG: Fic family protein [Longicatena sp.]
MKNKVLKLMTESKDYFEDFITRSVNTSNRIEGSTLSYVETYAILWNDNSFNLNNVKPRDFYEAVNLKYASNLMLESVRHEEQLTETLIIHLNETINKNILDTSGYRQVQVYIRGAKDIPPSAMEVREKMMYLVEDFNNNEQIPILEKAAHFHIMFEHIHPFEDGNGRTGRLLINFELIKQGQAPVIIPDERRVEYFNFIAEYDTEGLTKMLAELQMQEFKRMEDFIDMSKEKL